MTEPTSAAAPAERSGLLPRLAPRTRRRAVPRLSIALAAAGCALVVLGALLVGGDGLGGDDGGGSQLPGILLSAAVVVGGFVLLARAPSGPLATAGAVAAALGVPPLLFFLTFDEGSFPPYSTEAILFVSTGVLAVAYVAGPARARPLFLGAAAIGLWAALLQATEELFDVPFLFADFFIASSFGVDDLDGAVQPETPDPTTIGVDDLDGSVQPDTPDPTTIGVLSLLLAAAYLVVARRWDRQGFAGAATPLTAAALVIIPVGLSFLGGDLEASVIGLLTAAVGVVVAAHGASVGRRATTWLGAAGAAFGLLVVVGDLVDEATPGGLVLMVVGAGAVAGAEALRRATDEPDELSADGEAPLPF